MHQKQCHGGHVGWARQDSAMSDPAAERRKGPWRRGLQMSIMEQLCPLPFPGDFVASGTGMIESICLSTRARQISTALPRCLLAIFSLSRDLRCDSNRSGPKQIASDLVPGQERQMECATKSQRSRVSKVANRSLCISHPSNWPRAIRPLRKTTVGRP
ncbi:hypothetical protein BKA80DRAFT_80426 [Phyllosticta citrichinensis]